MTALKNGSVLETVKALLPYRDEIQRINTEHDEAMWDAAKNNASAVDLYALYRAHAMRLGDLMRRAVAESK